MTRRILLLGGASDIGIAIVERLLADEPADVVLAARADSPHLDDARRRLQRTRGLGTLEVLDFDAVDVDDHPNVIAAAFTRPVDVAIVAFGVLGDQDAAWRDQPRAVRLAQVNTTGAISVGVLLAEALRRQGGGEIIAISSMAVEPVRRSNFVYGATKAAMDAFYQQLGEALRGTDVRVLVVRPGFVVSRMTQGHHNLLAVTPRRVANRTVDALERGRSLVRVPGVLRPLSMLYRLLPRAIVRRLPV